MVDDAIAKEHMNRGSALHREGNFFEAINEYREALQLSPNNAALHNDLGDALDRTGQIDEAIREYMTAMRVDPGYSFPHYNLSRIYGRTGRYDLAIKELRECVRLGDNDYLVHFNLGINLGNAGFAKEAVDELYIAAAVKPNDPPALYNLGYYLDKLQRYPEASEAYRKFLGCAPPGDVQYINSAKNRLRNMTNGSGNKNNYYWIPILALGYFLILGVLFTIYPDLNPQQYHDTVFFPVWMFISIILSMATVGGWFSLRELQSINGGRMYTRNQVFHIFFTGLISIGAWITIDFVLFVLGFFYYPFLLLARFQTPDLPTCLIILSSVLLGFALEVSYLYRRLENNQHLDPELERLDAIQRTMEQQAQNAGQPKVVEKVIVREVVKVPCQYCGTLVEVTEAKCPGCGAQFSR